MTEPRSAWHAVQVTITAPVELTRRADVQGPLTVTASEVVEGALELGLRHAGPGPDEGVLAGTHRGVGDRHPAGVQAGPDVWDDQVEPVDSGSATPWSRSWTARATEMTVTIDGGV